MSRLGGIINRLRCRLALSARRATDDWQAGDLAVCIDTRLWIDLATGCNVPGPKNGDLMRVAAIKLAHGAVFLKFIGIPNEWFAASSFLKVRPEQREACTPAFAQLLRKHSREGVDA